MSELEREALKQDWRRKFVRAIQHDGWGQIVEAQDEYHDLAAQIGAKQGLLQGVKSADKDLMYRLVLCFSSRLTSLKNQNDLITSKDIQKLEHVIDALFVDSEKYDALRFPIESYKFSNVVPVRPSPEGEIIAADKEEQYSDFHRSCVAISSISGTVVCVRIDRIGLKDAQTYIDPFVSVLVVNSKGNVLDQHDTGVALERRATYVLFNYTVYLNVSLEDMERAGAAIFFEFKHYKPKKKKVSTRCWCFMEMNELKRDEEILLELYHKPTDIRKKKLKLHTEKRLYFHIVVSMIRP